MHLATLSSSVAGIQPPLSCLSGIYVLLKVLLWLADTAGRLEVALMDRI